MSTGAQLCVIAAPSSSPRTPSPVTPTSSPSSPTTAPRNAPPPSPLKLTTLPPTLAIRPRPIPHALLPAPYAHFCLTPYLASDADDMYELVNHPRVARGLGVRPSAPFSRADAARVVRRASARAGWPLNALRRTASLTTDHFPPLLGCITLARDTFAALPHALGERLRASERQLADQDAHWALQFCLDPALHGGGVMGAALRFVLSAWFVPVVNPYPGQLGATAPAAAMRGGAVARIHRRLGFVPLASVPGDAGAVAGPDDDVVCCAWMGAGVVGLEGSAWRGLGLVPVSGGEEDAEGEEEDEGGGAPLGCAIGAGGKAVGSNAASNPRDCKAHADDGGHEARRSSPDPMPPRTPDETDVDSPPRPPASAIVSV
ncbi:hypothetical protein Q8F55_006151 [Vanrija albida]|uniref:N-acetyltransferase domain-containing protein n=1 Tax=Vanrija albida TaxID=181172 RepID=A0ABR3PX75_9TREE